MNPFDILITALSSLTSNKMRAGLTLLGIVIGVTAVIVLLAIGRGAQSSITASIESLGSNLVTVTPGSPESGGELEFRFLEGGFGRRDEAALTLNDAYALLDPDAAPSVRAIAPEKNTGGQLVANGVNFGGIVVGVTPEFRFIRNYEIKWGGFISAGHVINSSTVAVLGSDVAQTLYGFRNPVGQTFKLNGDRFTVVGVLESQGGGIFGSLSDQQTLIPITTVHNRMLFDRTTAGEMKVDTINVQASSSDTVDQTIEEVTDILRLRHRITDVDDFTVTSLQQTIQSVQQATNVFVVFLGSVAGISLLVGGIGIMNIMLVTVTERTREIGIRKAMGAKRRDILFQFVAESSMLSFTGGLVGLGLGFLIATFLDGQNIFGEDGGDFRVAVDRATAMLAVGVSIGIGLFFGIYPAMRAARLHPIDALRYE